MRIKKCVKLHSYKIEKEEREKILELYYRYGLCKNMFYNRFSGINSMVIVTKSKKLRDIIREENVENLRECKDTLEKKYGIQGRHWVQVLMEVCSNVNSMWSNLSNKLKKVVRENNNINDIERNWCYYVLNARPIWQKILLREEYKIPKKLQELEEKIEKERLKYLKNMLCRITRKNKPNKSKIKECSCMLLDEEMYNIKEEKGETFLYFTSLEKGKRHKVKLRSKYCYRKKGDIQLLLKEKGKYIEIHKLIESKTHKSYGNKIEGYDKGLATLLSCSNGKEFGIGFSKISNKEVDRLTERNTRRNHLIQKRKEIKNKINNLKESKEKQYLIRKLKNIEKNNIGRKKYEREHNRAVERMKSLINKEIKSAYKESEVEIVVKEDLTFTKERVDKKDKSRRMRALLNGWTKGYIDERMEYIGEKYNIKTVNVNPAYTSQFCAECGSQIIERKGDHHEIGICPKCGEININVNAGKNIKARLTDKEIGLYTPYREVKEILLKRVG